MKNSMMIITVPERSQDNKTVFKSFDLLRLNKDCPYIEGSFNFESKKLTLICAESYETLQMVAKVNEDGNFTTSKTHKSGYKHERLRLHQHFSKTIHDRKEIEAVVEFFTGESVSEEFFKPVPTPEELAKLVKDKDSINKKAPSPTSE